MGRHAPGQAKRADRLVRHDKLGGGNCVEVARNLPGIVAVRDSNDHGTGPILSFVKDEWSAFVTGVKAGAFG
jgi:Domain of unknown function (DUF397)